MSTFIHALPSTLVLGMIWGLMAIGVYITYKILDIADLTVDGSICTGACVCAVLVTGGTNIWVALFLSFLAGAAMGLITALFHTFMGIPAILAGILTQLMLWSINLKILGKANMPLSARQYGTIVSQLFTDKSIGVVFGFVVVTIIVLYWFFGTEYGSGMRATGCNPKMAKAQGININLAKIIGLMISNGIVALSGALLAQYQGFADINMGKGAIVIGLAAVIIGTALISWMPKIGKNYKPKNENDKLEKVFKGVQRVGSNFATQLVSAILGGVVYYVVYQLVICLGLDTDLLKMLSALIVGLFLGIPYLRKKYNFKRILKKFGFVKKDVIIDSPVDVNVLEAELVVDEAVEPFKAFNEKPVDDAAHRIEKNKSKDGGEV